MKNDLKQRLRDSASSLDQSGRRSHQERKVDIPDLDPRSQLLDSGRVCPVGVFKPTITEVLSREKPEVIAKQSAARQPHLIGHARVPSCRYRSFSHSHSAKFGPAAQSCKGTAAKGGSSPSHWEFCHWKGPDKFLFVLQRNVEIGSNCW